MKVEVLSPVGDINTFYTAIRSGANAVYFGLPKFNARIKAENISLDVLSSLVRFAHLKDVKVYITINTIVTDDEMQELIDMVGECIKAKVDAFIVQDMGIISVLKQLYPDIELHGSTQMGIHNVRGARVAKNLGLSRIVLSREATLEDIKAIKENVDIEIEVFVQGALCVAFSGNCYMSSLKHNASGNRGLCKQLCRLPFELSNSNSSMNGYTISPSDICMLDSLKSLIGLGVASLKIEGRLRRSGYVAVATNVYRNAIDSILAGSNINIKAEKAKLSKVFARGDYICGYNNGNDIIEPKYNNHIGEKIGKVVSVSKFKDIFKITLQLDKNINTGDGFRILSKNSVTMGVGNIEISGKNTIVYGKNYVENGSIVYRMVDSQFENNTIDYSKYRNVDFVFVGKLNEPMVLKLSSDGYTVEVHGDICSTAEKRPITRENVIESLSKIDREIFAIGNMDIDLNDNIFVPLKSLNELRRQAFDKLVDLITERKEIGKVVSNIDINLPKCKYDSVAIVNEYVDKKKYSDYSAVIISPTIYNFETIDKLIDGINKPIIINLPIIARVQDIGIIDSIVDRYKANCEFIANNIYAIDYINSGAKVWAGSGLNICNSYSASKYYSIGVESFVNSIEKWCQDIPGGYKLVGKATLMTFAHCPNKTLSHMTCDKCKHSDKLTLSGTVGNFHIRRYRVGACYFEVVDDVEIRGKGINEIVDLRI